MTTRIDAALAAELENDERAIRIAEAIAHLLGATVEVLDAEGNQLWIATPTPERQD